MENIPSYEAHEEIPDRARFWECSNESRKARMLELDKELSKDEVEELIKNKNIIDSTKSRITTIYIPFVEYKSTNEDYLIQVEV